MKSRAVFNIFSTVVLVLCAFFLSSTAFAAESSSSNGGSVSPYYGSFSTEVPIAVPPFHGLEPNLKLGYSSTGRNGFAGVGWGLAGASSIERGLPGGGSPKYDAGDAFFLDGSELVPCTSQGGTHCTEIQNYSRIERDTANNKWYVTGTNGNLATYTSQYETSKGTFRWFLTQVEDPHGNIVTYTYYKDGNPTLEVYLDAITYNGTTITFYRESRSDQITYATGAGIGQVNYRLKSVDVKTGRNRVRAYKLSYAQSATTASSQLISAQQFGNDAVVNTQTGDVSGTSFLPPMTFSYQSPTGVFNAQQDISYAYGLTSPTWNADERVLRLGDFNGDGKTDLLLQRIADSGSTYLLLADGSGGFSNAVDVTNSYGMGAELWAGDRRIAHPADFNGDGKTDILFQGKAGRSSFLLIADGSGGFNPAILIDSLYGMTIDKWYADRSIMNTADFNGDGKTDLILQGTGDYGNTYLLLADGSGGFSNALNINSYYGMASPYWDANCRILHAADFNGDGNPDILLQGKAGRSSFLLIADGSGGFNPATRIDSSYGMTIDKWYADQRVMHAGDFNGDGKTDLLLQRIADSGSTYLLLADGSGGFSNAVDVTNSYGMGAELWAGDRRIAHPADFNGDGKTDILFQGKAGRSSFLLIADGSGGFNPAILIDSLYGMTIDKWYADQRVMHIGDFNGDGDKDIFLQRKGANYGTYLITAQQPSHLLTSLANGIGGSTTLAYTPSSAWVNQSLPVGMILQTVSSVTTSDGRGNSSTINYSYGGGLWSSAERRFLGFRKVTAALDAQGNYTETYYYQKEGSISKPEYTYYKDNQNKIFRYSYYKYNENSAPPYTSLMTERWEFECNLSDNCTRTLLQFAYDQYGNVITTHEWGYTAVDANNKPIPDGDERTSYRGYAPNNPDYLVGLPAYENTYAGITCLPDQNGNPVCDGNSQLKRVEYIYDQNTVYDQAPTKGDIIKIRKWNDQTAGYAEASMTYDVYGNVTSNTNERGTKTVTVFDGTYHLYPVQNYVELYQGQGCTTANHCATTNWDMVMGLKTSVADPNNAQVSYTYDPIGRPLTETDPHGKQTTYQHLDVGSPTLQRIVKTVPDHTADGLITIAYQDGLGREYRQEVHRYANDPEYRAKDTIYSDTSNRIWKESLWYKNGETPKYVFYTYDGLGRQRTATNPDGTSTEVVYANDASGKPYTATYDELDHEKVTWKDAYGKLIQVRETVTIDGALQYLYTTYEYDLLGNLVRALDAQGVATTATWDSLGRKLTTHDPNMGNWIYTYYDDGSLWTQTDAKNQVTSYTYDALGRVATKTVAGQLEATYYYDEPTLYGASIGRLTRVVHANGSETHKWDLRGQEIETTRCVVNSCRTIAQEYDSLGRVSHITYPDGEIVTNTYDDFGRLVSVGNGTMDYASNLTWSSSNQLLSMGYGNGTVNTFTYNDNRKWLSSAVVTGPGGTLYDAAYTYDAAARVSTVTSISNPLFSLSFTYDELNRVLGVRGAQVQDYAFDKNGNIKSNSQMGSYVYGQTSGGPQAVTQAGSNTYTYDANGNMLTVNGNAKTFAWDAGNRLASVVTSSVTTSYLYDAGGKRIEKSQPGNVTRYFGAMVEEQNGQLVKYYYAGPILVAKKDSTGTYWYHADHLGSIRLMTNSSGAEAKEYDYAAFGKTVNEITAPGTNATNERGFTGHVTDSSAGLTYMGARYYDADLGRFVSADTIVPDPTNPQALNRYSYVYNNPISNVDPTGHAPVAVAVVSAAFVTAAEVGTVITVVAWVGAGVTAVGYFTHDPVLSTIGSVMVGFSSGYAAGGAMAQMLGQMGSGIAAASVSAASSPISPLDPNAKEAIGWAFAAMGQIKDMQSAGAFLRNKASNYAFHELAEEVAEEFDMELDQLNMYLLIGSFAGNAIAGSRYQGECIGDEIITGFGTRDHGVMGLIFDVGDAILAYQGIPTASAIDYALNASNNTNLWGHSLGSIDANNLGALGARAISITSAALPLGNAGAAGVNVHLGPQDLVNGRSWGGMLNPQAKWLEQGNSSFVNEIATFQNHNSDDYLNFYIRN